MSRGWPWIVLACLLQASVGLAQSECPALSGATDTPKIAPPSAGGERAALNTLIQVDIDASLNPQFLLSRVDPMIDVPIAASWQRIGESDRFVIRPLDLLEEDTQYSTVVSADEGIYERFTFTTAGFVDETPPVFAFGPDQVVAYSSTPCGDDGTSHRVALTLQDATDDGHAGAIEYLVYLTRAAGLDGPVLLSRQYLAEATDLSFTLTPEQLSTPVCIVVDAVDGVGLHADPAKIEEFCFDPLQGNFFEPCAVGGPLRARWHGSLMLLLTAVCVVLGVRRRRLIPLSNRSLTQR